MYAMRRKLVGWNVLFKICLDEQTTRSRAFAESTAVVDIAQLAILIRIVDVCLNITEELLAYLLEHYPKVLVLK